MRVVAPTVAARALKARGKFADADPVRVAAELDALLATLADHSDQAASPEFVPHQGPGDCADAWGYCQPLPHSNSLNICRTKGRPRLISVSTML